MIIYSHGSTHITTYVVIYCVVIFAALNSRPAAIGPVYRKNMFLRQFLQAGKYSRAGHAKTRRIILVEASCPVAAVT